MREIKPEQTTRAKAYELWMKAPNPMVAQTCNDRDLTDSMVIGISAIIDTELDGAVGMNSGIFNNPFILWGKYKKKFLKYYLTISFQYHHTQWEFLKVE